MLGGGDEGGQQHPPPPPPVAIARATAALSRALASHRTLLAESALTDTSVSDALLQMWRGSSSVAAELLEEEKEEDKGRGTIPLPLPHGAIGEVARPDPALLEEDHKQLGAAAAAAYQVREVVGEAAGALASALRRAGGGGGGGGDDDAATVAICAACDALEEAGLVEE